MTYVVGYGNQTQLPDAFNLPKFRRDYLLEYIRNNAFSRYMGTSNESVIQLISELKSGGQSITIPLMGRLKKRGVTANMPLAGREETLTRWQHKLTVEYWRNGVSLTERDEAFTFAKALPQVKPALQRWSKEQMRDHIIDALWSVAPNVTMLAPLCNPDPTQVLVGDPVPTPVKFQATSTQLNQWVTDNADRICFGNTDANRVAGNFSGSIGNVTGSANVFGAEAIRQMMLKAKTSDPHITPLSIGPDGEEYWPIFVDPYTFRAGKKDPEIAAYLKDARAREGDSYKRNPLVSSGAYEFEGAIIREVVEMSPHAVSSGVPTVGRAVLTGQQAVAVGIGMDPDFRERKDDDYGHIKGVGIVECLGVNKCQKQNPLAPTSYIDHATVSGFFSFG